MIARINNGVKFRMTPKISPDAILPKELPNNKNNNVKRTIIGPTGSVSYTHLTLPTIAAECRSRWSAYH